MVNLYPRKRAFTLIELLIVITIIGILAVALVPRLTGGPARARDATRKSDLQQIAVGLEFYYTDNGGYPASTDCVSDLTLSGLSTVPSDPQDLATDDVVSGGCADGYAYIALHTNLTNTLAEGYLIVARSESTTETADTGLYYNTSAWSPTTSGATATAAVNLAAATACTASAAACDADSNRYYMIGH